MRDLGIRGRARGSKHRTTIPAADESARPADLVNRNFNATAPNRLWVCDLTYVVTDTGMCYVSFIIDCFARMIVAWQASRSLRTDLCLSALEQAIFTRQSGGSTLTPSSSAERWQLPGKQGGLLSDLKKRQRLREPSLYQTRGGSL